NILSQRRFVNQLILEQAADRPNIGQFEVKELIEQIRTKGPLVHCLTNTVVQNFTANGLLSFGASPIMATNPVEAKVIASLADAVLINIGTLQSIEVEAMEIAGKIANDKGLPVVFDPVGVKASNLRQTVTNDLLEKIQFTAIKGNPGEMAFLAGEEIATKGVDSEDASLAQLKNNAEKIAGKYRTIAVITGEQDVISDGERTVINDVGHVMLTCITGSGCLLGALIGAALTVEGDTLEAVQAIVRFYCESAELAMTNTVVNGPGTFQMSFLDELSK